MEHPPCRGVCRVFFLCQYDPPRFYVGSLFRSARGGLGCLERGCRADKGCRPIRRASPPDTPGSPGFDPLPDRLFGPLLSRTRRDRGLSTIHRSRYVRQGIGCVLHVLHAQEWAKAEARCAAGGESADRLMREGCAMNSRAGENAVMRFENGGQFMRREPLDGDGKHADPMRHACADRNIAGPGHRKFRPKTSRPTRFRGARSLQFL